MALVPAGACFSPLIAFFVGRIASWILRRVASFFTSSMTGKAPVPVPIHQVLALPGYLLLDGNWRVSEGFTELLGWLLLALADFTAIDHHLVLTGGPVNPDRTE
jgi:hypothetical protein